MDDILFKYLNNELTPDEAIRLKQWLASDAQNQRILYLLETQWQNREIDIIHSKGNAKEKIWKSIESSKPSYNWLWLKTAAILIFGVLAGLLIDFDQSKNNNEEVAASTKFIEKTCLPGQKISITLPDGTKVKMNAASKIIVPEQFATDTREVDLIGEAYFEVNRDESRPFIIRTQEMSIKVLGTAFNVRAYPDEKQLKVAVEHGKVQVFDDRKKVILEKDEMAVIDKLSNFKIRKTSFDPKAEFGWKNKLLFFENANIEEILKTLEKWYGVEINVKKKLDKKSDFSGEYRNKPLQNVLEGLSYVYDFKYEIKDEEIIIF